jgi:hemolysin activation/secretion protein
VDFNLSATDSSPLHASLELNNRYSPGTSALRLNGSVSDSNLWQLGHTAGLSFQASPEDWNQVKVFSGYYLAHPFGTDGPGLMLQGTKQDSNVSTLGGAAVEGRGDTIGLRALYTLPAGQGFYHSATLGFDYKQFNQVVNAGGGALTSPVTYYPFSAAYSATWITPGASSGAPSLVETNLNAQVVLSVRGLGSGTTAFANSRFMADESFIYLRGDVSQTRELPSGFQLYGKAQGQIASGPLLSAEEFSGGGLATVRGYLEGEVSGDNGYAGTVELRSPPLENHLGVKDASLRVFAFADAGQFTVLDPLPGQTSRFDLTSVGVGARLAAHGHFTGTLDAGFPLDSQANTPAHDWLVTFTAAISY